MYFEFCKDAKKEGQTAFRLDFMPAVEQAMKVLTRVNTNVFLQPVKIRILDTSFSIIKYCVVKYFCSETVAAAVELEC